MPQLTPILAMTALAVAAAAQDAAPVRIAHALAAGDRFAFGIDVDARIEFDDQSRDSSMRFVLHFVADVGPLQDELADVACTLLRIEASVSSPAARVRFDSADAKSEPGPLRNLAALVDATFHVHVDERGAIGRVDVPAELAALAQERLGSDFDSLFATYFVALPEQPAAPGQCWTADVALVDQTLGGGKPVHVRQRLAAIAGGCATIDRTFELPDPPARPGVRFELQRATGKVVFDLAAGRVVTADMELLARATSTRKGTAERGETSGKSSLSVHASREQLPAPARPGDAERSGQPAPAQHDR